MKKMKRYGKKCRRQIRYEIKKRYISDRKRKEVEKDHWDRQIIKLLSLFLLKTEREVVEISGFRLITMENICKRSMGCTHPKPNAKREEERNEKCYTKSEKV